MIVTNPASDASDLSIHRAADHILILLRCAALMLEDCRPRILNLDCGAGGLAQGSVDLPFGPWTGVDRSALALDAARATGCFATLALQSPDDFLAADPNRYSVVVCGQGLSSWSDLSDMFTAVAKHLRPGGLFLFSTEELPSGPARWRLGAKNRHAHTVAYVETVAALAGFIVPTTYLAPLRAEAGQWVMGRVTLLQRTRMAA